jgi:hypothetical protein
MLLLAWLEEEEEDEDNGQFYQQLDEEGCCCRDCSLPQPTLLLPSIETTLWMKL